MLQSKTKKTSRKFYGKWLYKVSLRVEGSGLLRTLSLDDIKSFCLAEAPPVRAFSTQTKAWNNREQLLELSNFLSNYDPTLWAKRIEHVWIDLYSNDLNFYNALSEQFESIISHRFEPPAGLEDLLDQPQLIVADKYPHNKYQYKVYLLPHKLAGKKEEKQKYVDWLKGQSPRITCTPAVQNWFIKTDWNWDRRYVLVENEPSLLMLKLRNSEVVGRVYKYHITDK